MSYTEWKHGWISDDEYASEYELDDCRADVARHKLGLVEDEEEDEETEDCEGE
jgi:hypothetical protein